MKSIIKGLIVTMTMSLSEVFAAPIILPPPTGATGDEIAIIWIQGALSDKKAYVKLATEVQN